MNIQLSHPFSYKESIIFSAVMVDEVTVRRATVKDLQGLNLMPDRPDFNDSLKLLISRVTGLSVYALNHMDAQDYFKIVKIVSDRMV